MSNGSQPLVPGNDWSVLRVPAVGGWQPRRSVSVVVPAHNPVHLPKVLAGLAAQSYPEHLLEVVVVDDGSRPPVQLPRTRPERCRVVRITEGWGRAAACQLGAEHSDGEVLHWLDADTVPAATAVEAQLRWHHEIDYAVVLGDKLFTEPWALDHLPPERLRAALASGASPESLARSPVSPHTWVANILDLTDDLTTAGPRAMRVHVGASASVSRELFLAAGGMPSDLVLGEDIVLGYRLREAGGVFVPDRAARVLHLGETTVMRGAAAVNRYNRPFLADKVPEFRGHRSAVHRSYEVPYVEVVLPVEGAAYETVRATVDHLLATALPDLVVTLTGPWDALGAGRRAVLTEAHLDLRLIRGAFASEPRVRLREVAATSCEATFRVTLPGPGWVPAGKALPRLVREMEHRHLGLVRVRLDTGGAAEVVRSAAAARARRVSPDPACLERALAEVYPTEETIAADAGFVRLEDVPPVRQLRGLVRWGSAAGDGLEDG